MASSSNNRNNIQNPHQSPSNMFSFHGNGASSQNNLSELGQRINPTIQDFPMPIHPLVQSRLDMSTSLTQDEVTGLLYFQESIWQMNFRMERSALEREKEGELRYAKNRVRQHTYAITAAHMLIANLQQTVINLQQIIQGYENAGNAEESDSDSDSACSEIFESEKDDGRSDMTGKCRMCRRRLANVVLLPCMHLYLCIDCSEVMEDMPCAICHAFRNGAIRVRLG